MIARPLAAIFALVLSLQSPASAEGDPGWIFRGAAMDEIPAPGEAPCRATKHGASVNTRLLRNQDDLMVLTASWHTWDHTGYPIPGTLSVDGGEPVAVNGYSIGPLYMVLISDDAFYQQLRDARTLDWNLPWGQFSAEVEGLGDAFDQIVLCPG